MVVPGCNARISKLGLQRTDKVVGVKRKIIVPRRLSFAAPQRIAITLSPNYYQKMQRSTTRKNQEEHGPEVK
jgi:hypothetical protein